MKRRKSINASTGETQHKTPTTANGNRLEAAFATVFKSMPNVYKTSYVMPESVAKFPEVTSKNSKPPIEPEPELGDRGQGRLADVLRVARTQRHWSDASDSGPVAMGQCSYLLRSEPAGARHARWRDCRHSLGALLQDLSKLVDIHSLSPRALAQLLVYWLDGDETSQGSQLPGAMREIIYEGMLADLTRRGKDLRSEAYESVIKMRWVKQLLYGELDSARETWLAGRVEAPAVDLDVQGDTAEPERNAAIK